MQNCRPGWSTKHRCQACSQAHISRVAKLSWNNLVVQNLRAFLILYVNTIKLIMCAQEKMEVSSISQRPRLSSIKISGDLSLATKIEQQ